MRICLREHGLLHLQAARGRVPTPSWDETQNIYYFVKRSAANVETLRFVLLACLLFTNIQPLLEINACAFYKEA